MARRAFYSFHYVPDNFRVAQVRNMGVIEGNTPASDNDWEKVKRGGDAAIKKWIDDQLYGKSVAIVLIGAGTAGRKWINYEINAAWATGKGLLGVHIHKLRDANQMQSYMGNNPFDGHSVGNVSLSSIVKAYSPPYSESKDVYGYIKDNLAKWIEEAITIRSKY